MNKRIVKMLASWVLVLGLVVGGRLLYARVFPYYLSSQGKFELSDGEYDETEEVGEYFGKQVKSDYVAGITQDRHVLGSTDSNVEKKIEVDLSAQMLYALEDGKRIAEFPVSTGKWDRTPTGTFKIWIKFRSKKMSGGSKELGTYYYLPNVPYIMFFYNDKVPKIDGYSLHGTYWHSNFGQVMSHGCVNMRTRDIEKLYAWAGPDTGGKSMTYASEGNLGTEVEIYGKAPSRY
jgi:lipoprotein-anchoring transpeptidase ErfK/SrfK